jgi:hypothetical protein
VTITLRKGRETDAAAAGDVRYRAFKAIAEAHNFAPDLPNPEVGAAQAFPGPGFLLPTRNGEMMRWCLAQGLRVTHTMTLMTIGLYNEPEGAWLPSVLY